MERMRYLIIWFQSLFNDRISGANQRSVNQTVQVPRFEFLDLEEVDHIRGRQTMMELQFVLCHIQNSLSLRTTR